MSVFTTTRLQQHYSLTVGAIAATLASGLSVTVQAQPDFVQNGEAGFVVSHIEYALSQDADQTGACPNGMSLNIAEIYALTPEGKRREGESDGDYGQRLREATRELSTGPNNENSCLNPEAFDPDPNFRTVEIANIPAYGINIDGKDSQTGGQCAHQDFVGMNGETGIDNQFFRVVGCSNSFQSTGQSNGYATEMLTGAWGILLKLSDVDDITNDDSVKVGIYANADPIQLSPTREPLPNATYAIDQDPRFRAEATGRIVDGVLTTDPVDVRFYKVTNAIWLERPLRDARAQMTLTEDGLLEGYLAGYTNVEDMYDLQFGFRNGKDGAGQLAEERRRAGSAGGAARVLGYTCNGVYHALHANADGHPDPETGKCTSISTQYRIKAIPAYVVDVDTSSINAELSGE